MIGSLILQRVGVDAFVLSLSVASVSITIDVSATVLGDRPCLENNGERKGRDSFKCSSLYEIDERLGVSGFY